MSLVLFYQPEPHKDLQPAEELVDEARLALYKKLNVKTFANRFWDTFGARQASPPSTTSMPG
jgi:hypothetical protein